jgi:hypothetical protein
MKPEGPTPATGSASPAPPFLDDGEIARGGAIAGLDDGSLRVLRDLAARIRADPQLARAAVAAHHAVFDTEEPFEEAVAAADAALGAEADLLHALYVLDSSRLVRERQAGRGVPTEMAPLITERHGASWLRDAAGRGRIGLENWSPDWLRMVASGNLHRLGRLEFYPCPWEPPFRAYKHRVTGELVVLADRGYRATEGEALPHALTETDDAVIGTPVSTRGVVLPHAVYLPRNDWNLVLAPGDPVIEIHVPDKDPLTIPALRDAMERAVAFFERYYPEHRFKAIVCDSWLFSPQLEAMLGEDSNILRWQREGYLMPGYSGQESFLQFTFGARSIDLDTAPRDTRLRRAIIDHLRGGGALITGFFLLLRRDLPRFGAQPYRPASDEAIARLSD